MCHVHEGGALLWPELSPQSHPCIYQFAMTEDTDEPTALQTKQVVFKQYDNRVINMDMKTSTDEDNERLSNLWTSNICIS